jgi:hypothetical protein
MNRFRAILASSALWFSLGANAFAADIYFNPGGGGEPNSCGEVSNEIPTVTTSVGTVNGADGRNLRCITDIDALRLTLHKAGLCTSAPDTNDPSADWADKCVFIIDDAAGIEFTVTEASTSAIPAEKIDLSDLVEATYTHAILMVGNSIKTKMNAKFAEDFRGTNGNGAFCYSINAVTPGNAPALADLAVNCVASEAAMIAAGDHDFSEKLFETFQTGPATHVASRTATNGDRIHLFKDLNVKATVASNGSASDATKVIGVMEMASPAVLSAASATFNAGFQLSGQGQIRFSGSGACAPAGLGGATGCISSMHNYGVGFRVTIE